MPWDGSGNIQRTNGTNSGTTVWQDDRDDGVNIRADRHDTHDEDLAGALENTVALDGQTTTTTDNSLLWYDGTDNRFEGFEVVANRIVGRKASGDVGALTPAEGRTVLSVYSQAEVDSYSPTAVTDGGTDAFTGNFGTDVSAGETVSGDFGSANTTTTPTLENTGGTPGALTITTRDGSALWEGALSGVHELQLASGGGSWLVLDPNPNGGDEPVSASFVGCEKIESGTVSGASSLDITGLSDSYSSYLLVIEKLRPATDDTRFLLRTSTDNGSNFADTSGDYRQNSASRSDGGSDNAWSTRGSGSAGSIDLQLEPSGFGNAAGELSNGIIRITAPMNGGAKTTVRSDFDYFNAAGGIVLSVANGVRNSAEQNNAIRLLFSSGNIAEMKYTLYGYRA